MSNVISADIVRIREDKVDETEPSEKKMKYGWCTIIKVYSVKSFFV